MPAANSNFIKEPITTLSPLTKEAIQPRQLQNELVPTSSALNSLSTGIASGITKTKLQDSKTKSDKNRVTIEPKSKEKVKKQQNL